MNVLSLFDGISVARKALELANTPVSTYYCSEVDKYAIQSSTKNWKDNIHLGDVRSITEDKIKHKIDLLVGGSPCQDLSIAKKDRKGLEGEKSSLFWEYIRIKELLKPKYFILENVASMKAEDRDIITKAMGVDPVMFNASLVSAQTRKRYFWTNIKFELPIDRGIILKDILEIGGEVDERMVDKNKRAYTLTATYNGAIVKNSVEKKQRTMVKIGNIGNNSQGNSVYSVDGKSCCLTANGGGLGAKTGLYDINDNIRKLTPIECERLQSLPDNYTEGLSNTQRYKCCGNAFNAEVIKHILLSINK